eukprot:m.7671 g.7671  ORF g.7671 m.7671 type:complete len:620 (+) comp19359_c0_seq1:87-1946(+)
MTSSNPKDPILSIEKKQKRKRSAPTEKNAAPDSKRPKTDEGAFENFRISPERQKILEKRGFTHLLPVQSLSFDHAYDGSDVIAQARTGTGKTLAYALPMVERLCKKSRTKSGRSPKLLVLAPTRELAIQVREEFQVIAPEMSSACFYGGSPFGPQENAIRRGLDILTGTPGRVMDQLKRGRLDLSRLKCVILDEADRMFDIGFSEQVEEILAKVFEKKRPQMMLFSATMPDWVREVTSKYMSDTVKNIDLIGNAKLKTAVGVDHKAIRCSRDERPFVISDIVKVYSGCGGRTMIFTDTKREANELALSSVLKQDCQVLHGDIEQNQREITLANFRQGNFRCLVATNVAARGLDIPEVDLVIQCQPPKDVDAYIHRAGRTGRAGRDGTCVIFYLPHQEQLLKFVERRAGVTFIHIGAPQPEDIVSSAARDAGEALKGIPSDVIKHFLPSAQALVDKEGGAVELVAAALAYMSGNAEIQSRSLLSSKPNYTTFLLRNTFEIRAVGYMWNVIARHLPADVKQAVQGMRMCKDYKGVAFDLPTEFCEQVWKNWKDGANTILTEAKELPALIERMEQSRFSNGRTFQPRNGYQQRNGFQQRNGHQQRNGFQQRARPAWKTNGMH